MKSQLVKEGDRWRVLPGTEIEQTVINFIYKSWGCENNGFFPGPQPISIERKHFSILKGGYMVCEKSDGVRHLFVSLMFGDKKMCFIVNRAFTMFVVQLHLPKMAYLGTILDAELVDRTLLIYDAVCIGNNSLVQLNLIERLQSAENLISEITKLKTDPIILKVKTFFNLKNFFEFEEYLSKIESKVDGLIFTPIKECIRTGTHETMFKWKPRDLNTIDFQAKKWGEKWGLYVQEKGRLVFESELSVKNSPEWIVEDCIVECQYMCDDEPRWWKPIGLRLDKKHANNRKTFYRTLVNIRENIQMVEFSKILK